MECRGGDGRWAGFFALVTYIPGPLGTDLDNLRQVSPDALVYMGYNHLNQHALNFREPFQYHPHVTLAQEFPGEQLAALKTLAESRWESCRHSKRFLVETLTFVQGTPGNGWVDLRHFDSVRSAITSRTS